MTMKWIAAAWTLSAFCLAASCTRLSSLQTGNNQGSSVSPGTFLIIESPLDGSYVATNAYPFNQAVKIYCAAAAGSVTGLGLYTNGALYSNIQNPPVVLELSVPVGSNMVWTVSAESENSFGTRNSVTNRVYFCRSTAGYGLNIQPPCLPGNPFTAQGQQFGLAAPLSNGSAVFQNWIFDANGDGLTDTGWTNSSVVSVSVAQGGTRNLSAIGAVTANGPFYHYRSRSLKTVWGGSGSFTEINAGSLTSVRLSSITLGDIDGDGDQDLILTGYTGSSYISQIYRNDGSGNFAEINAGSLTGVNYSSIVLGDIDGDGDLDLILTGYTGLVHLSKIYRNDGSGSFAEVHAGSLTGVSSSSVVLGDIDGDGDLDLILTGNTGSERVSKIYINDKSGSFTEINAGSLTGVSDSSIALGDLDGDGDLDLVLTGYTGSLRITKIYQNDRTGGFIEINSGSLTGVYYSCIALADIDGDGDLDLILTGSDGSIRHAKVYRNDGSGSFTELNPGSLSGVFESSIMLGDFDEDGDLDLLLTGRDGASFYAKIYRND